MKSSRLIYLVVGVGCLLVLAVVVLFNMNRSTLMKKLPAPKTERIEVVGSAASGTVIDCAGGWYNDGKLTELIIRSEKTADGWSRPERIVIRNCRIRGSIRILGMGRNGEAPGVRESSIKEGHTERAQAAAPTGILISNVDIEADYRIPIYLAPGVTGVTLENCRITGWSCSTAVCFDCESGQNIVRSNLFAIRASRELIAVDGSAGNRIEGNRFERIPYSGILLYRNPGEAGTVRHQTPNSNLIVSNYFNLRSVSRGCYGVWLGSRNGRSTYRDQDAGYNFGSSVDNRDFADHNTLTGNLFVPAHPRAIRDDGRNNHIEP